MELRALSGREHKNHCSLGGMKVQPAFLFLIALHKRWTVLHEIVVLLTYERTEGRLVLITIQFSFPFRARLSKVDSGNRSILNMLHSRR